MVHIEDNKYPLSEFCIDGLEFREAGSVLEAMRSFKQGAETGCVTSIFMYASSCWNEVKQPHWTVPWLLEGSIRGHVESAKTLGLTCYRQADPSIPHALLHYWMQMTYVWMDSDNVLRNGEGPKENSKEYKKITGRYCTVCLKTDDSETTTTLQKCAKCRVYFYCGRECQLIHWKKGKHSGECKQLKILKEYHRPYANEIREAFISGDENKINSIQPILQELRNKLGLTRPQKEYEEFMAPIIGDNSSNGDHCLAVDPYKLVVARSDGTVHLGSLDRLL